MWVRGGSCRLGVGVAGGFVGLAADGGGEEPGGPVGGCWGGVGVLEGGLESAEGVGDLVGGVGSGRSAVVTVRVVPVRRGVAVRVRSGSFRGVAACRRFGSCRSGTVVTARDDGTKRDGLGLRRRSLPAGSTLDQTGQHPHSRRQANPHRNQHQTRQAPDPTAPARPEHTTDTERQERNETERHPHKPARPGMFTNNEQQPQQPHPAATSSTPPPHPKKTRQVAKGREGRLLGDLASAGVCGPWGSGRK